MCVGCLWVVVVIMVLVKSTLEVKVSWKRGYFNIDIVISYHAYAWKQLRD